MISTGLCFSAWKSFGKERVLRMTKGIVGIGVLSVALVALLAAPALAEDKKPNILVIWGDDIGQSNVSAYTRGMVGYKTPNIDRIADEGMMFTDYYGEQSCTAGRSSFITGQSVFRREKAEARSVAGAIRHRI